MTATAAEVTKTAENTFRDLQIAAVNPLALSFEAMGINVYAYLGRGGVARGRGDIPGDPLAGRRGRRPLPDEGHLPPGAGSSIGLKAGSPSTPSPAASTTSCPDIWCI